MPALVAGTYVLSMRTEDVDGRVKREPEATPSFGYARPRRYKSLAAPPCSCRIFAHASMAQRGIHMTLRQQFSGPTFDAAAHTRDLLAMFVASPARADHCDDLANQLKNQIDGLKVGITAANIIYLSHPLAKEMSLGCARPQLQERALCQAGRPQAEARLPRPRRRRCGHRLHPAEGRHADRHLALHEADGAVARRHHQDALPPAELRMHPHQDRGVDRDHPRHG